VTVELAFPDPQYPDVGRAQYETIVAAEGDSLGGCATTGAPGPGIAFITSLVALGGAAAATRRRRTR
jgi:MYXO-CTERM domain-containing protein